MRKALRNKELTMIIFSQFHRHMLAVCWRTFTDIHGNIQHSTLHASHQPALGKRRSLESISPLQRPHYFTSSYTYLFLKKVILLSFLG